MSNYFIIKSTGDFWVDLSLALNPQLICSGAYPENSFVRYVLYYFFVDQASEWKEQLKEFEKIAKKKSISEIKGLIAVIREKMDSFPYYIYHQALQAIESVVKEECPEDPFPAVWKDFFGGVQGDFLFYLAFFVVLQLEDIKRFDAALNKSNFCMDSSMMVLNYKLWKNDPDKKRACSLLQKALGIDVEKMLLEAHEKNITLISRITIRDENSAESIQIGELYYEELHKLCEKKLADLSNWELQLKEYDRDENCSFLPNRVMQQATKKLTDSDRIEKEGERLRKKGISKKEVEEKIKGEWQKFWDFKTPFPVVITDRDEEEEGIAERYIPTPGDQVEVISYVQTKDVVTKRLQEGKETIFKKSPAGKAYINYLLENKDNEEAKFTNREIAAKTGFNEDAISRVRKKLQSYLSKKLLNN